MPRLGQAFVCVLIQHTMLNQHILIHPFWLLVKCTLNDAVYRVTERGKCGPNAQTNIVNKQTNIACMFDSIFNLCFRFIYYFILFFFGLRKHFSTE